MTQFCTEYPIQAPVRTHKLRLKSDPSKIITSPDDTLKNRDILLDNNTTGRHVHLNLIDTPGLSDSNQQRDANGMSTLDELHKMGILVALSKISELHAVCFVVSRHEAYSGSLQGHISSLMRLFDLSFRHCRKEVDYHVIHTWITIVDRFPTDPESLSLDQRALLFNEKINLQHTVKHHFIDSHPRPKDLLSVYYRDRALSGLLRSFSRSLGVSTSGIVYPREVGHVTNDRALQASLNVIIQRWEEEERKSKAEAVEHESDKKPFLTLQAQYDSQCLEIQRKIQSYDTSEDTYVASKSGTVETEWYQLKMVWIFLELQSETPISKFEKTCTNGSFDCVTEEEKKYRVCLNTINYSAATGTIKIYSERRHVFADIIKRLHAEISEIKSTKSIPEKKILEKDKEKKKCLADAASARSHINLISKISENFNYLSGRYFNARAAPPFQVKDFSDRLRFLAVNNLLATATAYGNMDFLVPKRFLPAQKMAADLQIREVANHLREEKVKEADASSSKVKLEKKLKIFENWVQGFEKLVEKLNTVKESIQHRRPNPPVRYREAQEQKDITELFIGMGYPRMHLCQGALRIVSRFGKGLLVDTDGIDDLLSEISTTIVDIQEEVEPHTREFNELLALETSLALSVKVSEETLRMAKDTTLQFWAYVAVEKAINDGVRNPYLRLIDDVIETLKIRSLQA
jgi:hypothetical protein